MKYEALLLALVGVAIFFGSIGISDTTDVPVMLTLQRCMIGLVATAIGLFFYERGDKYAQKKYNKRKNKSAKRLHNSR